MRGGAIRSLPFVVDGERSLMGLTKAHTLSDGTTLRVRIRTSIAGTFFTEVPSWERKTSTMMRLDTRMFILAAKHLVGITHPDYSYAEDDKAGAEIAMKFFVECAESCIAEALKEGIPVAAMYGAI